MEILSLLNRRKPTIHSQSYGDTSSDAPETPGLIRFYSGPDALLPHLTGILGEVRKRYNTEGVDPHSFIIGVAGQEGIERSSRSLAEYDPTRGMIIVSSDAQYHTLPLLVHETSHKIATEKGVYQSFERTANNPIWQVTKEDHESILASRLGRQIQNWILFRYDPKDNKMAMEICQEYTEKQMRAVERRLGRVKREEYERFIRVGGIDESLARAITFKLTGEELNYTPSQIISFSLSHMLIVDRSLERLQGFLRKHKYRDIFEMGVGDLVNRFG